MARLAGSEGICILPSAIARRTWGGGKLSTMFWVLMCRVSSGASRASRAELSILSGWSCCSIHLSTPILLTISISPGRGPKVRRFRACSARFSSSICGMAAAALDCAEALFDFFFLSAPMSREAPKLSANIMSTRPNFAVGERCGMRHLFGYGFGSGSVLTELYLRLKPSESEKFRNCHYLNFLHNPACSQYFLIYQCLRGTSRQPSDPISVDSGAGSAIIRHFHLHKSKRR